MQDIFSLKTEALKKSYLFILFVLLTSTILAQKDYTVRGFIYNGDNGEGAGYVKVILRPVEVGS